MERSQRSAHGALRSVSQEFHVLPLSLKLACVGEMIMGYLLPIAGIILYAYLRSRRAARVFRLGALVGVAIAVIWYMIDYVIFVAALLS